MMKKVLLAGIFLSVACGGFAMPVKTELLVARERVEAATAPVLDAFRNGTTTAEKAALEHELIADRTANEADKYLLLQGAFKLYARCGKTDMAVSVLRKIDKCITDVPYDVIADLVHTELHEVASEKANEILEQYRQRASSEKKREVPIAVTLALDAKAKSDAGKVKADASVTNNVSWRADPVESIIAGMKRVPGTKSCLSITEVTERQWESIMGNNPSGLGPNRPVGNVSWDDANEFISKLNANPKAQASGYIFRLPSTGEWNYTALAGSNGKLGLIASGVVGEIDQMAWYVENSGGTTHDVGTKMPNAWGFFDMHGNVWEWTNYLSENKQGRRKGGGYKESAENICHYVNGSIDTSSYRKYAFCGLRLASDAPIHSVSRSESNSVNKETAKVKSADIPEVKAPKTISLGNAIDAPQYNWTTSEDPWIVVTDNTYDGVAAVQSSGGGGGVVDTWMKTTVSGVAKTMTFRFQKSYYQATFSVQIDGKSVFSDSSVASPDKLEWIETTVSIPEGTHELKFNYHHPGKGWANRFNGVRIDTLKFKESVDTVGKDILRELPSMMVAIPGKYFKICKYEVTQALWEAVMGDNPSFFKGADLPVEQVSWDDCQAFITNLNEKTGGCYRLPTTYEWVYACRAGSACKYGMLANGKEGCLEEMGWYKRNSGMKTHPVGQKKPNAFGIFDMHGNVKEWTADESDYTATWRNCAGNDFWRKSRGGSWRHSEIDCTSTREYGIATPGKTRDSFLGLRLVSQSQEEKELAKMERIIEEKRIAAEFEIAVKSAVENLPSLMVNIPGKKFKMCKYEVTQALWVALMGDNPSKFRGPNRPVENVSVNDCMEFLKRLNKITNEYYRLPTEEEWAYACRAGGFGEYGNTSDGECTDLNEIGWYIANSGYETHNVGLKKPNAFGLYDMLGNVGEWASTSLVDKFIRCGGMCDSGLCTWKFHVHCKYASDSHMAGIGFRIVSLSMEDEAELRREQEERNSRIQEEFVTAKKVAVDNLPSQMIVIPGKNYKICKYEVTQALWEAVMGSNPSRFKGANLPVECVSWDDCQTFMDKLNEMTGEKYRFPSLEEWNFACLAGSTGKFGKLAGGMDGSIEDMGWYCKNSDFTTHPVGLKKPNAFGLFDMHGNVSEWSSTRSNENDPNDTYRRFCGGGYDEEAFSCEARRMRAVHESRRDLGIGLRLALSTDGRP